MYEDIHFFNLLKTYILFYKFYRTVFIYVIYYIDF